MLYYMSSPLDIKCDYMVGHNPPFTLMQSILARRVWKAFRLAPPP